MIHPTIARVEEERDLLGRLLSTTGYDAAGQKCVRIEYDPDAAPGEPYETWRNVRDDIARTGGINGEG